MKIFLFHHIFCIHKANNIFLRISNYEAKILINFISDSMETRVKYTYMEKNTIELLIWSTNKCGLPKLYFLNVFERSRNKGDRSFSFNFY